MNGKIATVTCCLVVLVVATAFALPSWMSVAVRQGAVRQAPMPFGKITASLAYGERVDILSERAPWMQVRVQKSGLQGWMHSASLLDKKIALASGEKMLAGASDDELTLGGKGFNAQVEAQYRQRGDDVAYQWVDRMEKIEISAAAMQGFISSGGLTPREGGYE